MIASQFRGTGIDPETKDYDCIQTVRVASGKAFHFRLQGEVVPVSDENGGSDGDSLRQLRSTSPLDLWPGGGRSTKRPKPAPSGTLTDLRLEVWQPARPLCALIDHKMYRSGY